MHVHMFSHIRPPLNAEEARVADRLVAVNNLEPGWVSREIIADEIRSHQAMLKATRKQQLALSFQK